MSRKKIRKKGNKGVQVQKARAKQNNFSSSPVPPDMPNLEYLAKPWQEFYRLVIKQIKQDKPS